MMLDVWQHVLMVGIRAGQRWVIWMREGVVPVELLFAGIGRSAVLGSSGEVGSIRWNVSARDLVAVAFDDAQLKVEVFLHAEGNATIEDDHPFYSPEERADGM